MAVPLAILCQACNKGGYGSYVGILSAFHIFFLSLLPSSLVCKYLLDHAFFLLTKYVGSKYDMCLLSLLTPLLSVRPSSILSGHLLQVFDWPASLSHSLGCLRALLGGIGALCGLHNICNSKLMSKFSVVYMMNRSFCFFNSGTDASLLGDR